MRPVNLIPLEERSGARKAMRGGPLAYIVVGALLAALGAVTLLVVTNNQISSRTAEVSELTERTASAEVAATRLAPYTQFNAVSTQRTLTVSNLADSRFDWEQVMRQLALVLPHDVWLTNLTASVRPEVSVGSGENIAMRSSIPGPALSLVGCAAGQEAVAGFVTVLKDIDGVTRVGVQSSELASKGNEAGSGEAGGGDCRTRPSIAQFSLVIAFDAAPVPVAEEEAAGATSVAETTESGSSEGSEEGGAEE
jgi:Tfp pilus assembly protein PilN